MNDNINIKTCCPRRLITFNNNYWSFFGKDLLWWFLIILNIYNEDWLSPLPPQIYWQIYICCLPAALSSRGCDIMMNITALLAFAINNYYNLFNFSVDILWIVLPPTTAKVSMKMVWRQDRIWPSQHARANINFTLQYVNSYVLSSAWFEWSIICRIRCISWYV